MQSRRIVGYGKTVLLCSFLTTGAVMGARLLGWLQASELNAYDEMVQRQPAMVPDARIVVVGITEQDIGTYGWPIPDQVIAKALEELQRYQPRVIGFDLYRDIAHPPGTEQLRSQLAASNVIAIETLGGDNAIPAPVGVPPERVGFNNFLPDSDNVVRRNLMAVLLGEDEHHYSFALRVSQAYLVHYDMQLTHLPGGFQLGETTFPDLGTTSGSYHQIHPGGYQILARYHPNVLPAMQVSLNQVVSGDISAELVQDRVVLVGTVAPSIKDLFYTPYSDRSETSQTAGVMVHAHFTSHILRAVLDQERLIWFIPDWVEGLWILAWAIVGGMVVWAIRNPLLIPVGVIIMGGILAGSCYLVFLQAGWIPLWPALLTLVATSGIVFAYETLYKLFYDTLTGLPQKTLFLRSVQQAITPSAIARFYPTQTAETCGAMLCLDLNGFKRVNESLGHEAGDRILLIMTQRIRQALPPGSQFARLVSDKFLAWVNPLPQQDAAIALARSIQDHIKQPITVNTQELVMSASVGIALRTSDTVHDADELLRDAQTAMHQAKSRGKSQIEVFNRDMRLDIIAHFQTEADLRYAIERQELRTYYQPFISLRTGKIAGFEALIRWQHPEHGLVSPGKFIPVAEDTDLIIPIGHWILQEACQQMRQWHINFPARPHLIISVNLSGRQFTQPDLVQNIRSILEQTGLEGKYLKLELTESILMDDVGAVIDTLNQMKKLDLQVSIDDFGTGYSSLSYLHRFPINTLKVDRSFVMHIDEMGEDHAIVETIIALGHHLGMDVIAEGIETAEQAKKLKELQCEYGQGYFFAKPMPADAIEDLLTNEKLWLSSV
ncbi:MAG: EAL domain-containing protein [Cyanothece sp. SIO2G6]|nr:EAL domain-containing protein [Cyanothece sp. SIO2G6]